MRKLLQWTLGVTLLIVAGVLLVNRLTNSENRIAELRAQHQTFLKNSPFKETLKLTKKERKARGIPPNKFAERNWELTMNPALGKPEPEKLLKLQESLSQRALFAKVPGENSNSWVERGPNNVGGRTRAVMFDPNDATHKRVFAGGVSGGLWVNNDITNINSSWAEVNIPQNLAISCITYDPNDTMTFYVGTGESYVQGDANGNGVWKSIDGGTSWTRVFGGSSGSTQIISGASSSFNARVTVNSPGGIAGDYFGIRGAFGSSLTPITGNLVLVDDGTGLPNEGCSALVNAAAINGNIAVINRGTCEFGTKVLNAQNAGAVAAIVVNNVTGNASVMAEGVDGASVTIPCLMVSMADGQTLINQLGSGVNVSMNGYRNYSGYTANPGTQHINDIKVRDIGGGNSEVYVAAGYAFYSDASPSVFLGPEDYGLYKSTNNGTSWSKLTLLPSGNSNDYQLQPNDIEIAADNTIWVSTTGDVFGDGGGEILSSTDGTNFSLKYKVPGGDRTQIAVSGSNASTLYVLAELFLESAAVTIIKTDDAFATTTSLPLPIDADTSIAANDFTRGQAFYDLVIEVDPSNDAIVYVGGIDLFRSGDSGAAWSQISEFYTTTGLSGVHPDHHAFAFHPTDPTIAVNGNDGGVYYASSLSTTPSIVARNKNYNTLQFYNGSIGQETANEKFLAGAQDNGSQFINNATSGINESASLPSAGDGGYVFIDKDNEYIVTSTQNGNYYYLDYATGSTSGYVIDGTSAGAEFINPAALDSDNNYLFSAASGGVNRYNLGTSSATADVLTDALLTGSASAFATSNLTTKPTLFIGTDTGKLIKLTNSTSNKAFLRTWNDLTGAAFVGSISSVEIGASENEILVTFYNYGVTNIFYTTNGGVTWQNKEGDFPDIPVRDIMMNPLNTNEVIIATDLGVWGTPNFGDASPNWYRANNGMKDVPVHSLDLRTSDNTVLAATHGRGMFTGQFTSAASTLSIDDKAFNDLIKIYPTVSKGDVKISGKKGISTGGLNIFDMNGREVYASKINFNKGEKEISLNVSAGLYIVKFVSEGKQSTHKIIIE